MLSDVEVYKNYKYWDPTFTYINGNFYLIVEGKDAKTAQWFYADYSWQALDEAKSHGFDEIVGFCVVKTMEVDQVSFECME